MPRYAAFLRGVSPMNARMSELRRAFEQAGFTDVTTILSSGNVLFSARGAPQAALERKAEAAMRAHLGRGFLTIVRRGDALGELLRSSPYAPFRLGPDAKRVITFLRTKPEAAPRLPIEREGVRILVRKGREVFTAYVPGARRPMFMELIEETFGKEVTTRTWETVARVAQRARGRAPG